MGLLSRNAGLGLAAGAVLTSLCAWVAPMEYGAANSSFFLSVWALALLAGILVVFNWPKVHDQQSPAGGKLSTAGMVLVLLAGAAILFAPPVVEVVTKPNHAFFQNMPLGLVVFYLVATFLVSLGGVLFGIASLRAKVYTRFAGWLLIVAAVVSFLAGLANLPGGWSNLGLWVFMLALAWYGLELNWHLRRASTPAPRGATS